MYMLFRVIITENRKYSIIIVYLIYVYMYTSQHVYQSISYINNEWNYVVLSSFVYTQDVNTNA